MAEDFRTQGVTSGKGTRSMLEYVSGWAVRERSGGAAVVKFRDSLALPAAVSAVDSGGGTGPDTGLHYYTLTWATPHNDTTPFGQSLVGAQTGTVTTAGNHAATVTVPTYLNMQGGVSAPPGTSTSIGGSTTRGPFVYGRRLYRTKAAAPGASAVPTNAQWFLVTADVTATVAAGSTGAVYGITNSPTTISFTAGTGTLVNAAANVLINTAKQGPCVFNYLTTSGGNTLNTVTLVYPTAAMVAALWPQGIILTTADAMLQPMIVDNTSTSLTDSVTDAAITATNPPLLDTAGESFEEIPLVANAGSGERGGPNIEKLLSDGGLYVEVTSGAVSWRARGK